MKYILYTCTVALLTGALMLGLGNTQQYVYAHNNEASIENGAIPTPSLTQMEHLVKQLRQIIQLLTVRNQLQHAVVMQQVVNIPPTPANMNNADTMLHDHTLDMPKMPGDALTAEVSDQQHDHHEQKPAPHQNLIIEVEAHMGRTHVHIRYVDKPEDMFFVDARVSDTNAIITTIHDRTGLSTDVIGAAITYPGV